MFWIFHPILSGKFLLAHHRYHFAEKLRKRADHLIARAGAYSDAADREYWKVMDRYHGQTK